MDFEENIKEITEKKGAEFVAKYTTIYQLILRLDVIRNYLNNIDKLVDITNKDIPIELNKQHTDLILKEVFILHLYSFSRSLVIDFKELDVEIPDYCVDGTLKNARHKCVAHLSDSGDSEPLKAWKQLADDYPNMLKDYESIKHSFNEKLTNDLIKCGIVLK